MVKVGLPRTLGFLRCFAVATLFTAFAVPSAPSPALAAGDAVATRVSEDQDMPDAGWIEPGFRLQLHSGYEMLEALHHEPRSVGIPIVLTLGLRQSEHWSGELGLQYSLLSGSNLDGLRWAFTLGPQWHIWEGLSLGLAAGYAGLDGNLFAYTDEAGIAISGHCRGHGAIGHLQLRYLFVLGNTSAMGPIVQVELQGLQCNADTATSVGSTGINPPWWWHRSMSFNWAFAWR